MTWDRFFFCAPLCITLLGFSMQINPVHAALLTQEVQQSAEPDKADSIQNSAPEQQVSKKQDNPEPTVSNLYSLGIDQLRHGDAPGAALSFEEVLKQDRKHVPSMINLTRAYLDLEQYDKASRMIDEAIAIDSANAKAHLVKGRVMQSTQNMEEATTAYLKSIQLDGFNPFAYNNLALIYIQNGTYHEAIPLLEKGIGQKDDVAYFHNNLGIAYEGAGDQVKAEEAFQQALNIDPGYEKAITNLERIQTARGDRSTTENGQDSAFQNKNGILEQADEAGEITRSR